MLPFGYVLRNVMRRGARSAATIGGIMATTLLVIAMTAFADGLTNAATGSADDRARLPARRVGRDGPRAVGHRARPRRDRGGGRARHPRGERPARGFGRTPHRDPPRSQRRPHPRRHEGRLSRARRSHGDRRPRAARAIRDHARSARCGAHGSRPERGGGRRHLATRAQGLPHRRPLRRAGHGLRGRDLGPAGRRDAHDQA